MLVEQGVPGHRWLPYLQRTAYSVMGATCTIFPIDNPENEWAVPQESYHTTDRNIQTLSSSTNDNQKIIWLFEFGVYSIKLYMSRTMYSNGNTKEEKEELHKQIWVGHRIDNMFKSSQCFKNLRKKETTLKTFRFHTIQALSQWNLFLVLSLLSKLLRVGKREGIKSPKYATFKKSLPTMFDNFSKRQIHRKFQLHNTSLWLLIFIMSKPVLK